MCFMTAITAYCQQELVKIMLFAGSEEPHGCYHSQQQQKLNLTMTVIHGIMLNRGVFCSAMLAK